MTRNKGFREIPNRRKAGSLIGGGGITLSIAAKPTTGMRHGLSVYLDLVRFLAAFGVFLSHAATFVLPTMPERISTNGPECVAVFFVLSGFVIRFASLEKGETNWRVYFAARSARIYSVAPIALVTAAVVTAIGQQIDPSAYLQTMNEMPQFNVIDAIKSGLFLNEIWFTHSVFASNEPYWSLGFEVPYYIFFAIIAFLRGNRRIVGALVWFLIFGLKILAFLPLWWIGVLLYDALSKGQSTNTKLGYMMIVASVLVYAVIKFGIHQNIHRMYDPTSAGDMLKGMLHFYIVGIAVAINFAGVSVVLGDGKLWNSTLTRAIRWIANGSFTLYLVHLPLLALARALDNSVKQSSLHGIVAIIAIMFLCYSIAELGERRKRVFRDIANRVFRLQKGNYAASSKRVGTFGSLNEPSEIGLPRQ